MSKTIKKHWRRETIAFTIFAFAAIAIGVSMLGTHVSADKGGTPQASITLTNCAGAPCQVATTDWTLTKTAEVTGSHITWTVTATKGGTSNSIIHADGTMTVTNTGSANATIGNIVVNLQKPNSPKKGSNAPYVSVAADVADATNGDAATSAKIVASASQENATTNALWGTNNYTVSGAQGTFIEGAASGSLEFTDASDNSVFSLTPQVSLAPGASITLLYTADFDNTILGLPTGSSVRVEALVSFGNSGGRGGSGATANNIDINGNGHVDPDEANVRTVPCRVNETVPEVEACDATPTLTDTVDDIATTGDVSFENFTTTITGGTISDTTVATVEVDVSGDCGTITNTAHLDAPSSSVTVNGPIDPSTGLPIVFTFECCPGLDLDAASQVAVGDCSHNEFHGCTYTKGGYGGPGAPGQIFDSIFTTVFSGGLTIGFNDGAGPSHHALWTGNATGQGALKTYLTSAAGGSSTALSADTTNATSTDGGSLPRQTATLALNIGFSGATGGTPSGFGNLKFCNLAEGTTIGSFTLTAAQAAALNGNTINSVLVDANNALAGFGLPGYVGSFGDLNQLVTALNESYDNCAPSAFATANLCP